MESPTAEPTDTASASSADGGVVLPDVPHIVHPSVHATDAADLGNVLGDGAPAAAPVPEEPLAAPPVSFKDHALAFLQNTGVAAIATKTQLAQLLEEPVEGTDPGPHERLCHLLEGGDRVLGTVPENVQSFAKFSAGKPWADATQSFVFHRDHKTQQERPPSLVQRVQLSGLCYLHAPAVMRHYLLSMTTREPVGMIDLTKLVRSYPPQDLLGHLLENRGAPSSDVLRKFVGTSCRWRPYAADRVTREHLESYGPALVHGFTAYPDFMDPHKWLYVGSPAAEKSVGKHAMVLIGIRIDDSAGTRFLLQNWWPSNQFVEVDVDYMLACDASITFVKGTPAANIKGLEEITSLFAETTSDAPDCLSEEQLCDANAARVANV